MTYDEAMEALRGHESWKWYGYPGHLIVAESCVYHLTTRVGQHLVSTVGDYRPKGGEMERIGAGDNDYFETMVFPCDGEHEGNPVIADWCEEFCDRYATSIDAERGHYDTCWLYHRKGDAA